MPYKIAIFIVFTLLFNVAKGQPYNLENNIYNTAGTGAVVTPNARDYQALNINPANLAYPSGNKVSFGLLEFSYLFSSDALTRDELQKLVWNPADSLTFFDKHTLANNFTNKGFGFDLDIRAIGLSVNIPDIGGIAIQGYANADFHSQLNDFVSNIIFNGFNYEDYFDTVIINQLGDSIGINLDPSRVSELFNGTELSFTSYAGISAGIGANLFQNETIKLLGGAGIKRLWGMGIVDVKVTRGDFNGFIALPAGIGFKFADAILPELDSSDTFEPAGKGWGFDLGLAFLYANKIKASISITDIGSILYDKNVYELEDFFLDSLTFSGINQYNYLEEIDRLLGNEEVFRYKRLENRKFELPMKLRLGTSYRLNQFLQIGFDVNVPLNDAPGNIRNPLIGAGVDINFRNIFSVSPGITFGGNHGLAIPLGVSIGIGENNTYQAGFASQDVTSYFTSEEPILSGNFAFLKFSL